MAKHQAAPGAERVSVTALLFPLVSVLYFEAVFSYFARTGMTVYKVLFALSAGAFGLALSRLTPSRVLNFLLQSAWLLFCGGLAAAQYLCFAASGAYVSLFGGGALPSGGALLAAAAENLPFLACLLLPPLAVQCTLRALAPQQPAGPPARRGLARADRRAASGGDPRLRLGDDRVLRRGRRSVPAPPARYRADAGRIGGDLRRRARSCARLQV